MECYKGYYIRNFDGVIDNRFKNIIDDGTFLRHAGNWDYILLGKTVYYIAVERGCASGTFSSLDYYNREVA